MALYDTISPTRRNVEQGNTWTFEVEPAITQTNIAVDRSGGGANIYDKTTTLQWHGIVHLAKRYRYVGLMEDGIDGLVDTVREAYTVDLGKWAIGIDATRGVYRYMQVGTSQTCCASVTPVHGDGPAWEIEVDVDATAEIYSASDAAPTSATMKSLLAGIADFPEDAGGGL